MQDRDGMVGCMAGETEGAGSQHPPQSGPQGLSVVGSVVGGSFDLIQASTSSASHAQRDLGPLPRRIRFGNGGPNLPLSSRKICVRLYGSPSAFNAFQSNKRFMGSAPFP